MDHQSGVAHWLESAVRSGGRPRVEVARGSAASVPTMFASVLDVHTEWAWMVILGNALAGLWCLGAHWIPALKFKALWAVSWSSSRRPIADTRWSSA